MMFDVRNSRRRPPRAAMAAMLPLALLCLAAVPSQAAPAAGCDAPHPQDRSIARCATAHREVPLAQPVSQPGTDIIQAKAAGVAPDASPASARAEFLDAARALDGRCVRYARGVVAPEAQVSAVRLSLRNHACAYQFHPRGILEASADPSLQNIYILSGREELRPGYFLIDSFFSATDLSADIEDDFALAGLPMRHSRCAVLSRADISNTISFTKFRSIYCLDGGILTSYYYLASGVAREALAPARDCARFPRQLYPAYCAETYQVLTEDWTIEAARSGAFVGVPPVASPSRPGSAPTPPRAAEPSMAPVAPAESGPIARDTDPTPGAPAVEPPVPAPVLAGPIPLATVTPPPTLLAAAPAGSAAPGALAAALTPSATAGRPADAPPAPGAVYVQLGMLSSEAVARTELDRLNRRLRDLLSGLRIEILRPEPDSPSAMLRLRAGRFDDADAARSFCEAVRERRISCRVIGGSSAAQQVATIAPVPPPGPSATPEPAPAAPAAPAALGTTFRVQLGALPTEEAARSEGDRLARRHDDLLSALSLQILRIERQGAAPMFVLRAGPLPSPERARALCDRMRERRIPCAVIRG